MLNSETTCLTPPQLARRWGTNSDKVLKLVRSGQLAAINLAVNPNGRPRYRIYVSEIERFEKSRANKAPTPKRRRRRTAAATTKEYF